MRKSYAGSISVQTVAFCLPSVTHSAMLMRAESGPIPKSSIVIGRQLSCTGRVLKPALGYLPYLPAVSTCRICLPYLAAASAEAID
jgi:hypothetical protein